MKHARATTTAKPLATVCVAALAVIFSTAFFFSRPSIEFKKLEHDFGEVPEKSEQKCEFAFRNKGSGTLKIERVSAG